LELNIGKQNQQQQQGFSYGQERLEIGNQRVKLAEKSYAQELCSMPTR
jgi:hypothetical protein